MKIRTAYAAAGLVLAACLWVACNGDDDGPTSPTPTPTPPPVSTTTAPPTPTPPAPPVPPPGGGGDPIVAGFFGKIYGITGTSISADVVRQDKGEEWVHFACYKAPAGVSEIGQQTLFVWDGVLLDKNDRHTFKLDLPGCEWQCDLAVGPKPRTPPFYTPETLIAHRDSVQVGLDLPQVCAPPPPPPGCTGPNCGPPPPPECDVEQLRKDANAECEGEFTLDVEACTFECTPPPPPECDVEALDAEARRTAAAQCGELGVESITLDTEACTFEFTCNPPPPECDEEALQAEAAAAAAAQCEHGVDEIFLDLEGCEFDFTCLPPPPPECDEETEVEIDGVCVPICEAFPDRDECNVDVCNVEGPVTWCHVSSKKNGGINEDTMFHAVHLPPGHCLHFDPEKWFPPDYLGECDGRSFLLEPQ